MRPVGHNFTMIPAMAAFSSPTIAAAPSMTKTAPTINSEPIDFLIFSDISRSHSERITRESSVHEKIGERRMRTGK